MPTGPKQTLVLPTAQQHTVDKYGRHRAMIISSSGSTQKPATHRRHLLEYSANKQATGPKLPTYSPTTTIALAVHTQEAQHMQVKKTTKPAPQSLETAGPAAIACTRDTKP